MINYLITHQRHTRRLRSQVGACAIVEHEVTALPVLAEQRHKRQDRQGRHHTYCTHTLLVFSRQQWRWQSQGRADWWWAIENTRKLIKKDPDRRERKKAFHPTHCLVMMRNVYLRAVHEYAVKRSTEAITWYPDTWVRLPVLVLMHFTAWP